MGADFEWTQVKVGVIWSHQEQSQTGFFPSLSIRAHRFIIQIVRDDDEDFSAWLELLQIFTWPRGGARSQRYRKVPGAEAVVTLEGHVLGGGMQQVLVMNSILTLKPEEKKPQLLGVKGSSKSWRKQQNWRLCCLLSQVYWDVSYTIELFSLKFSSFLWVFKHAYSCITTTTINT